MITPITPITPEVGDTVQIVNPERMFWGCEGTVAEEKDGRYRLQMAMRLNDQLWYSARELRVVEPAEKVMP